MDIERGGSAQPAFPEHYRAGFVSLVGRPNAGKSTLTNALVGQKVAIYIKVAPKQHATRFAVFVHRDGLSAESLLILQVFTALVPFWGSDLMILLRALFLKWMSWGFASQQTRKLVPVTVILLLSWRLQVINLSWQ